MSNDDVPAWEDIAGVWGDIYKAARSAENFDAFLKWGAGRKLKLATDPESLADRLFGDEMRRKTGLSDLPKGETP